MVGSRAIVRVRLSWAPWALHLALGTLLLVMVLLPWAQARACSLDGVASLSANGQVADLTTTAPDRADLVSWAPFTLVAAAPGALVRLQENLTDLRRSLPPAVVGRSFRWSFGDGSSALGHTASHRYARTGWYKISVSYAPAPGRWFVFDSARMQIVPASALWRANLRHYAQQDAQIVLRILLWLALAGGLAVVLWKRVWRRGRSATAPIAASRRMDG